MWIYDLSGKYHNTTLLLHYKWKKDANHLPANHPLGFDELWLTKQVCSPQNRSTLCNDSITAYETQTHLIITGTTYEYHFNKLLGTFDSLVKQNHIISNQPIEYNIFRAPTDNDRNIRNEWQHAGFDKTILKVRDFHYLQNTASLSIQCKLTIAAVQMQPILEIETEWIIDATGSIQLHFTANRNPVFPSLPRLGLRFFVPKEYETVNYLGYGPYDSYIDKHCATWFAAFESTVTKEYENYIKPQEHGSHYNTHNVTLTNAIGKQLKIDALSPFSFNASHYTQEELTFKSHNYELQDSNQTILCIDLAMSGIGSNSCGPGLDSCYQANQLNYHNTFYLQF